MRNRDWRSLRHTCHVLAIPDEMLSDDLDDSKILGSEICAIITVMITANASCTAYLDVTFLPMVSTYFVLFCLSGISLIPCFLNASFGDIASLFSYGTIPLLLWIHDFPCPSWSRHQHVVSARPERLCCCTSPEATGKMGVRSRQPWPPYLSHGENLPA